MVKWISVDKGLPADRARVLTYCPTAYADYKVNVHVYYENYAHDTGMWWMGSQNYAVEDRHITHWAVLPNYPEEQGDG